MVDELDGVEIKLNFGASQIEAAMRSFGLDPDRVRPVASGSARSATALADPSFSRCPRGGSPCGSAKKKSDGTLKLRGPDGCIDVAAWSERTANADAKIAERAARAEPFSGASADGRAVAPGALATAG